MKIARLNDKGLASFGAYLLQLRSEPSLTPPLWLLHDPEQATELSPSIEVSNVVFANRFEAAKYLSEMLDGAGLSGVESDVGLWAWLALFYFDQVCPPGAGGARKPGEYSSGVHVRLIPAVGDFQKYYRHLLLGPYLVFRAHSDEPERALALLATALDKPGEVVGQIASRQELVTNPGVVGAATALYYRAKDKTLKRGTAGKGMGSARRLAEVLAQFDVTWDLYSMSPEMILSLLPAEFDRFKK